MAQTNVQAFSGDVEVADSLTATNLIRGVVEEAVRWNSQNEGVFPQSASTRYYKIATLGTTGDGANGGKLRISGTIGGFGVASTTLIDAFVASRGGIRYGGTLTGHGGDDTGDVDFVVYLESDSTFSVWIKVIRFFAFDFTIMGGQVSNNTRTLTVLSCPTTDTSVTTPTGTLQGSVVDSCSVVFTDDGNVGIGTTNPVGVNGGQRLEGSSSTGFEYIATRDDTTGNSGDFVGAYLFKNADTAGTEPHYAGMSSKLTGTNGPMDLRFHTNRDNYEADIPQMIISGAGNVGIGITNPQADLTIFSSASQVVDMESVNNKFGFRFASTDATNSDNRTFRSGIYFDNDDNYGAHNMNFCVTGVTGIYNKNVIIASTDAALTIQRGTRNVGIGTTNPSAKLDVNGSTRSGHDTDTTSYFGRSAIGYVGHSDWAGFAHLDRENGSDFALLQNSGGQTILNCKSDQKIAFSSGDTAKMTMLGTGNVGIGTADPQYRLEVGVNTSTVSRFNVIAIQPHIMWKSATAHWQVWNNGTDTHLRFWCDADRAYLQCSGANDLLNFTGQHRTFIKDVPFSRAGDLEGLIVSSDQNKYIKMSGGIECGTNAITVNESLPVVSVSNVFQDKRCFGVISTSEDPDTRQDKHGNLVSIFDKEGGDTRVYINSVGEGAIWVTDINGSLESGDYITTSNVAGYGQKQDSEFLANYTVAKITMDCDFEPVTQSVQIIRKEMGDVNYWVKTTYKNVSEEEYSNLTEENRRIVDDIYQRVIKEGTKTEKEGYELEVRQELVNVLDEHSQIQWEDHPTETEKAYKIRYLDASGVETDEASAVHIAAFVGCTYHCG